MQKRLHVVYKTHLDIGFTDLAKNVVHQYLYDFIPKALELGEIIPEKFTWTTGSWLIDLYLEHPDVTEINKERMRQAIKKGTIHWHALPFTIHTELMDGELMDYATSISQKLDCAFDKTTIASKMTDIPGHTISMVPYLKKAGIDYMHIGVNASSAIPKVPNMFVWRGVEGSEVIVHYATDYGEVFARDDWSDALYFAHSHDNMGPPQSTEEIEALFSKLEKEYPEYDIIPSSLDAFARGIMVYKDALPVIEEEIADSWIHGVAADPKKIAEYKALLRLRTKWLKTGRLNRDSEAYKNLSAHLLLVAEHTWGVNGNVYLPEYRNFLLDDFETARKKDLVTFNHDRNTMDFADLMSYIRTDIDWTSMADRRRYSIYEASWQEQRHYLEEGLQTLPEDLQKDARAYLLEQKNMPIVEKQPKITPGMPYNFDNVSFTFSQTGGLSELIIDGYQLIDEGKEFGGLSYEPFDFSNYSTFFSQYSRLNRWTTSWAMGDFGRRGIEAFKEIRHEIIKPFIIDAGMKVHGKQIDITFDLSYREDDVKKWGLPNKNILVYRVDLQNHQIDLSYQWQNKKANRMPEGYWLETSIHVANPTRWVIHKMNYPVNPLNVIENGNRNMHILSDEGMTYTGYEGQFDLISKDAPLMSMGRRTLLNFDNTLPNLNDGLFINLFNNIWGTNFPAWYEGDMTYHLSFKWKTNEIIQ
ncbi:hypothetical protein HMI01_01910 [Halolactibacillus miurensis]|uniref:Glycosyl hydrolases family 38 N-terminal domain-containing protein n=1 Tax=Halolactibacillus miurensis TaxID=306541 RepID=A0A1I6P0T8_9BACI|nr:MULTISPECIES: DUF5054 domain-containing protein [Halolactibacillus]GEM03203.1 hypothetical protein HMI01_01910 [Halolactibacillus miurensis]SFS33708.1 protein of unknown function [Halolactibacillus miurensis]